MKRLLLSMLLVLTLASVVSAGTWNVNIPGLGSAKSKFGLARGFDQEKGESSGQYGSNDTIPAGNFVVFASVSYDTSSTRTLQMAIRLTNPNGTTEWKNFTVDLKANWETFWFWGTYNLDDKPTGTYAFDLFVNGEVVGGIDFTKH